MYFEHKLSTSLIVLLIREMRILLCVVPIRPTTINTTSRTFTNVETTTATTTTTSTQSITTTSVYVMYSHFITRAN